ncbi:MAG: hypothetical protein K0S40_4206 [Actinomycetospora sp.]|nr:hypothetical protein [Actinomycetospora sp.]
MDRADLRTALESERLAIADVVDTLGPRGVAGGVAVHRLDRAGRRRAQATDADRSAGDGDREVRGPAGELLLVATGRPAGLAALEGPGVEDAAARL